MEALARQALGDQRSRDAAPDDQRIAFQVLAEVDADRMLPPCKPRRTAAPQVGMFGVICIEDADNETSTGWRPDNHAATLGTGARLHRLNEGDAVWFQCQQDQAGNAQPLTAHDSRQW
ncbi:hypothetical protein [Bradyrhizobium sp.]|uniref:hypothetical protein n=1 Tax=Bradyrhizobium sp. TaxID=376 RepID=UPI0025B7E656|nr:hypothetical protein [Bradyrhizobium sp.]